MPFLGRRAFTTATPPPNGVGRFMAKVYATTGLTFGGSLGAAYALSHAPFLMQHPIATIGVGFVGGIGSLIWLQKSKFRIETANGVPACINSTSRKAAFLSFVSCQSLVMTPLVATMAYPLVPVAAGLTCLVMGTASLAALKLKDVSGWSAPLMGGLAGLIGLNVAGLISHFVVGPNVFSSIIYSIEPYIGIGLFTAMTAYDTRTAIEEYQANNPDHLSVVINMYLNAINLFIRISELLSRRD